MRRAILVAMLAAFAFVSTSDSAIWPRRPAAGGGQTISDDCSDMSGWSNLGTSNWSSVSSVCNANATQGTAVHGTTLDTQTQYVAGKMVDGNNAGLAFRAPSSGASVYHVLRYEVSSGFYASRHCTGAGSCTTMAACANTVNSIGALANGDSMGLEATGLDDSLVISVWRWAAQAPPVRASWGAADLTMTESAGSGDCTWTTSTYAPSGNKGVGLYTGDTSNTRYDDFEAGDF